MEHYLIGWLVFSVIIVLTLVMCGRWTESATGRPDAPSPLPSSSPRPTAAMSMWGFVALGLLIVGVAPLSAGRLWTSHDDAGDVSPALFRSGS